MAFDRLLCADSVFVLGEIHGVPNLIEECCLVLPQFGHLQLPLEAYNHPFDICLILTTKARLLATNTVVRQYLGENACGCAIWHSDAQRDHPNCG